MIEPGGLSSSLDKEPILAGYATARYFAVHTFYFKNAKGERRPARWTAGPGAGEAGLTRKQKRTLTDGAEAYAVSLLRRMSQRGQDVTRRRVA